MGDESKFDLASVEKEVDELLPTTLDQLRTFVAVCEELSPRRGGKRLNREQTSVEKQLTSLETHFRGIAGTELIIRSSQRGGDIKLTRAGKSVRKFAETVLASADEVTHELGKLRQQYPIKIALTTFMIPILSEVQPTLKDAFDECGFKLDRELIHVRSAQIQSILDDRSIDFSLGGIITEEGAVPDINDELEFIEYKRDGLGLLSNYEMDRDSVEYEYLKHERVPLIVPKQGIIYDLLVKWFGSNDTKFKIDTILNIVEWCDDVHFGTELLRLQLYKACMISTEYITNYVKQRADSDHIKFYPIGDCRHRIRVGIFRRKEDRAAYQASHALSVFWKVFEQEANKGIKRT